ncbi:MAG: hypothetical protein ABI639_00520 [Thermoanaerobaculia bacterium]
MLVLDGKGGRGESSLQRLAAAILASGRTCRALSVRDLGGVRDATVVFPGSTALLRLLRTRLAGNRIVLDVQSETGCLRRPGSARLIDAVIFRNDRHRRESDRPQWKSCVIYEPADPGLEPHSVPAGAFRVGCFASDAASAAFREVRGVAFIATDPARHATQFNCHLALPGSPFDKAGRRGCAVANAAACDAVLVTPRSSAALELLGEEYPFYCATDPAAIQTALGRARDLQGTSAWDAALAAMRRARETTAERAVVAGHLRQFLELDLDRVRDGARDGVLPVAG